MAKLKFTSASAADRRHILLDAFSDKSTETKERQLQNSRRQREYHKQRRLHYSERRKERIMGDGEPLLNSKDSTKDQDSGDL